MRNGEELTARYHQPSHTALDILTGLQEYSEGTLRGVKCPAAPFRDGIAPCMQPPAFPFDSSFTNESELEIHMLQGDEVFFALDSLPPIYTSP